MPLTNTYSFHSFHILQQGGAWFEAEMGVKQDFPKLLKSLSGGKITIKNNADLKNRWWALDISIWLYQALSLKDVSTGFIPFTSSSLMASTNLTPPVAASARMVLISAVIC